MGRILVIIFTLFAWNGWAQKYFVTAYHLIDGLPSEKVRMTTTDSLGFLWIATDAGLVRFDGKQFNSFASRLESQYIKALAKGPDDRIYLVNDMGVYAVSVQTDTAYIQPFITAKSLNRDQLINYPNNLFWDTKERLWISQPNGSLLFSDAGIIKHFPFEENHKNGSSNSRFSFAQDSFGTVWVAAPTGQIYTFNEARQKFEEIRLPFKIHMIEDFKISNNQLWIGGNTLIRATIDSQNSLSQIKQFSLKGLTLTNILPTPDPNEIYLGSKENGFFKGQIRNRELLIQPIFGANDPHRVEELPFQNIHQIYQDKEGLYLAKYGPRPGFASISFF